ncbi:hypothetical protein Taro_033191 [Colocasia esculenta]|uniref:Uncharacterized protein n=1 Tax=Colocasia esculenta TaxID=4460 RepID=A0A843VX47_COLES|nr:hypothetical protein [Colocasia esculenta]
MVGVACSRDFRLCNACKPEKLASTSLDAGISVGVHMVDAYTTQTSIDIDAKLAFGQNSKHSMSLLELSICYVCHVAPLVERCDNFVVALPSGLRCIAWLPCVLGLRYAVVLAGAFWWVFPDLCLGGSGGGLPFVVSGGGSSLECSVFISGHRCVAPVA